MRWEFPKISHFIEGCSDALLRYGFAEWVNSKLAHTAIDLFPHQLVYCIHQIYG